MLDIPADSIQLIDILVKVKGMYLSRGDLSAWIPDFSKVKKCGFPVVKNFLLLSC